MENNQHNNKMYTHQIFDSRFMESKALFLYQFNTLPNVCYVNSIDGEKAHGAFREKYATFIKQELTYRWYKHKSKKFQFDKTIVVLTNECLLEFDSNYCEISHNGKQDELLKEITDFILNFKERQKREPSEINIIVRDGGGLELKAMEIKRTRIDLDLFYEDDFKEVDEVIRKRLKMKKDKGIVLLHGLPGTGKTTYLRYLIGNIKKRVMFLSPNLAGNLMNPEFIDLLVDNTNTVLIIEDAENVIMDRKLISDSAVSNLLNISDGLLADFLNVQLICTFNSPLTMIDSALLRKGRLIAKYEFGKLSITKAQRLSDHLGFKNSICRPMTLAEITNQNEKEFDKKQVQVIGFRREALYEN